jgi:PAS domain S-box-containing protein
MSDVPTHDRSLEYLVDSVSDYAIYLVDCDGRVTTWNRGAVRLKGYEPDEIIGKPFTTFFPLEDRRAGLPERLLATAAAEGKVENEGWRIRKDGSRFWALGALHAVRDESGELIGFAKVTRDLTGEREAQQALIESEQRFRMLVEGVIDYAIYMLDVNGVITNWNRGAERIKGYSASDIIGRHFSIFYTPEDRAAGQPGRTLETARREGRFEAEGWRLRKDGSRFWASVVVDRIQDDNGRLIGFAKITRDVSQKRAAEEALAESERQFRLLVSSVVDYALYMLDPNGIVTNWNAGAQHIKGYTAEEIVGHHFSRFYTDADRAAGVPMRALQTAAETGRYEAEGWRVRKDGSLFWASVVLDAMKDDVTGQLVGFAKITRDITDKRNAQLELQRAQEHLAQAQKMEALGKLTGGVAHDFNNLLMVVSGQAQLLRKRLADDERSLRALDAIEASAKRGEDLTRHLLAFSRRQRLQPTAFSLAEGATTLTDLLGASLPSSVQLDVRIPPDTWPVQVDPSEFELALINLAVNARDAMPGGGRLALAAENVRLAESDEDGALSGEFVAISVRDSGSGIPPDILPRIFDPFFTTKEVNKGTGLGLSQVYGFAEQTGGRVTVESELGRGTVFTIYLPRATAKPTAAESSEGPEATGEARILVVEDNPEVADVAAAMLEQLGHKVKVVVNAAAALEAVQGPDAPELVFSDIVMAGELDGLALARELRTRSPGLPILLATGYSQAAERIGAEFPILRKPYRLAELSRAVGALLARAAAGSKLIKLDEARQARGRK